MSTDKSPAPGFTPLPLGVTVLVTDSTGRQVGVGSDFEALAPGGWSLREAQERRARTAAWWNAMDRTCRTEVAQAINQGGVMFDASRAIRHRLMEQSGWREHVIVHGHGEDD